MPEFIIFFLNRIETKNDLPQKKQWYTTRKRHKSQFKNE
jgi:hypothetical protein